jgi:hypothetical protein
LVFGLSLCVANKTFIFAVALPHPPSSPPPRPRSTCRERCGGQGYLSCNRFGSLIGFSHAGITAEGDNRVLFQKAAKELLASPNAPTVRAALAAAAAPPDVTPRK